ncbi:unnamed protein product [Moneuplotes crassus]|uniref:Uncharacterized protein n=1 Tax=Euplotes crassus TaxID=5936 RepID=A0AAD1UDK4_EUPCR|nr:unnamed protein product [Moneuplotes crassus]
MKLSQFLLSPKGLPQDRRCNTSRNAQMAELQSRLMLNSESAKKTNQNSRIPQFRSINNDKIYVKVEDYCVSNTTSFSSIDERQFQNVVEGFKHTQKWTKTKRAQCKSDCDTYHKPDTKPVTVKRSALGEIGIDSNRSNKKNPHPQLKEVRKQRIKNECSEYLQSTILSKLRDTRRQIMNAKIEMRKESSSIISTRSAKENMRPVSNRCKTSCNTRSVEKEYCKAIRNIKNSTLSMVNNVTHRSRSANSVARAKSKTNKNHKKRGTKLNSLARKVSQTSESRSKSKVTSSAQSNVPLKSCRSKSSLSRYNRSVNKTIKRFSKKFSQVEMRANSKESDQRKSRWMT